MCWNKGRLYCKIANLFYFCQLKKLVRSENFGPYYIYIYIYILCILESQMLLLKTCEGFTFWLLRKMTWNSTCNPCPTSCATFERINFFFLFQPTSNWRMGIDWRRNVLLHAGCIWFVHRLQSVAANWGCFMLEDIELCNKRCLKALRTLFERTCSPYLHFVCRGIRWKW